MPEIIVCGVCQKTFHAPPSHRRKYCSKICGNIGRVKKTEDLQAKYRVLVMKDHPLSGVGKTILEHRLIMWDHIGRGPHQCHRCGVGVSWFLDKDPGCKPLVIDHIDRDSKNNHIENLAVSCQRCNIMNSTRIIDDDETYMIRPDGTRLRAVELTCPVCRLSFLRPKHMDLSITRYCSPRCMYDRGR